MPRHLRGLRHRIHVVTESGDCDLLTIGHLAAALRRSRWTVLYWERLGLLPGAPFVMNAERSMTKRRLYPAHYVRALAEVMERHYSGPRLEHEVWASFQRDVHSIYDRIVVPLLGGVTPPIQIELVGREGPGLDPTGENRQPLPVPRR